MLKKRKKTRNFVSVSSFLNLSVQDVVNYVQKLHSYIKNQNKKITKLRLKVRKLKFLAKLDQHLSKEPESQVNIQKQQAFKIDETPNERSEVADQPEEKEQQENVLDFVNEIKAQAMVNSFQQAGFIYEPTSGLYYDTKSKYYYNPEYDLYYDGQTGNWLRLNPRTQEFIFHSGTASGQAEKKEEIDEDEAIRQILEDGRKPLKSQESSKNEKLESKRKRHTSTSSSNSSHDARYYRRKYRSRSRSRSRRSRSRSRSKHRERKRRSKGRSKSPTREDGECSSDSESDYQRQEAAQEKFKRNRKKKRKNEYEEIAKKYPPSLRLIVIETTNDKVDVGKLFVVTYKGGSLGREGNHHDVIIPDVNVSKNHLKFVYHHKKSSYQLVDHSRNGTILNGTQVSLLNQEDSEPTDLSHGSILQLAQTKLLCHIHSGHDTCSECEPFNYAKKPPNEEQKVVHEPPPNLPHKEQLKLLQKRYGLQNEKYQEKPSGTSNKNYSDRAEKRRVKVGSSHDGFKVEQASVNQSISSENKGFKLLSKMGWSEGKSIGKSDSGIKEPVQLKTQQGTSGLGSDVSQSSVTFKGNTKKQSIWNKTKERYNNIKTSDDSIFKEIADNDE